jgi:putative transposase
VELRQILCQYFALRRLYANSGRHRHLIHVLPSGFHRIRYFGFLGNCHRARKLALCRELLGMAPAGPAADPPADYRDRLEALTGQSLRECPHCHTGIMVVIDCIAAPKICQPDAGSAFRQGEGEAHARLGWRRLRRTGHGRC